MFQRNGSSVMFEFWLEFGSDYHCISIVQQIDRNMRQNKKSLRKKQI